jgi:cold shock CspA family protein
MEGDSGLDGEDTANEGVEDVASSTSSHKHPEIKIVDVKKNWETGTVKDFGRNFGFLQIPGYERCVFFHSSALNTDADGRIRPKNGSKVKVRVGIRFDGNEEKGYAVAEVGKVAKKDRYIPKALQ